MAYGESRGRFYEYLQIIRTAWASDRFSYAGEFYSYDDVCLTPKPFQRPHPPFRVAATTTDTFSVLGELGYPIFIGVRGLGVSQVAEQVAQYRQAWDDAGHEGEIDVSLRVPVYVGESVEEAITLPEYSFMKQFRRLGAQLAASVSRAGTDPREERAERSSQLAEITWDEVRKEKVAVGTPDMVIDQLGHMRDALSLSGVVAEFNAGEEIPPDKVESSFEAVLRRGGAGSQNHGYKPGVRRYHAAGHRHRQHQRDRRSFRRRRAEEPRSGLSTDTRKMPDEYAIAVNQLLPLKGLSRLDDIDAVAMCSVVPPLTPSFINLADEYFGDPTPGGGGGNAHRDSGEVRLPARRRVRTGSWTLPRRSPSTAVRR